MIFNFEKKFVFLFFLFIQFSLINPLSCHFISKTNNTPEWTPFFIVTIPKSGTHLLVKLMKMMLNAEEKWLHVYFPGVEGSTFINEPVMSNISEEEVLNVMIKLYLDAKIPFTHTSFTEPLLRFSVQHPEYKKILLVRDLRDVIVSFAFFAEKHFIEKIGPSSTIEERIKCILNSPDGFLRYIQKAMLWVNEPETFVIRFEDIIGKKGGGNVEIQKKTILKIAQKLNIKIDSKRVKEIVKRLFGKEKNTHQFSTFKSGQIGTWKKYFNQELIELFNEKMASFQLGLGYDL